MYVKSGTGGNTDMKKQDKGGKDILHLNSSLNFTLLAIHIPVFVIPGKDQKDDE